MEIPVGSVLRMKKTHPCGCSDFLVLRVGADFKIQCQKCGHTVLIPRARVERNIKQIVSLKEEASHD